MKNLFAVPTVQELAKRYLAEHERDLIKARRNAQAAQATVNYHERVIADLRRTLAESRVL